MRANISTEVNGTVVGLAEVLLLRASVLLVHFVDDNVPHIPERALAARPNLLEQCPRRAEEQARLLARDDALANSEAHLAAQRCSAQRRHALRDCDRREASWLRAEDASRVPSAFHAFVQQQLRHQRRFAAPRLPVDHRHTELASQPDYLLLNGGVEPRPVISHPFRSTAVEKAIKLASHAVRPPPFDRPLG